LQAFQELQGKMVNTQQQLKVSDMQITQLKSQIQYTKLVEKEVASLPEDVPLYESVGRM
jgi:prefoldin subunit 1